MKTIVYQDYTSVLILQEVYNIICNETDYGRSTTIEVNDTYYYLGDQDPVLASAIALWQDLHDRELTINEVDQILNDNVFNNNEIGV